jgi:hypothetical protein
MKICSIGSKVETGRRGCRIVTIYTDFVSSFLDVLYYEKEPYAEVMTVLSPVSL